MSIDSLRCVNYDDFSIKLNKLENVLGTETPVLSSLNKILEFIEINQDIFISVKKTALSLDSIAAKVRHLAGNEELVIKLRRYVKLLIPSNPLEIKDFLQLIRNTFVDPSERLQALVNWVDLMRIPLAQLELTEDEFVKLVTNLEYPDLTNFDFQSLNGEIVTRKLLTHNLKFKTTEVNFLSTLAKFCAEKNSWLTAELIQKFAISDELIRVKIAKICAQNDPIGWTGRYFRNFAISDEQRRIEVAKLCAHKSGAGSLACDIQNFGIGDKLARIEIAKLCAKRNGGGTAEHILEFAIWDWDELEKIEIAKLCAQNNGRFTAKLIQNFMISNELARIEIAKLCANQDGGGTAEFIQKFAIGNESVRIEIATLCSIQNVRGTASRIGNFAIANEQAKVEIAKLCANQDGFATAEFIQKFAIGNEAFRIEIATLCAKQNARGTTYCIGNFAIADVQARIEIAKLCANQDGFGTAYAIQNFGIEDKEVLFEIAKLCVHQNSVGASEYLHHFQIEDPHSSYELLLSCVKKDAKSLFQMDKISMPEELKKIQGLIHILKSELLHESSRKELFEEIKSLIAKNSISKENLKIIFKMSDRIQSLPPHVQNPAGLWLISFILFMKELPPDNLEWLVGTGIWSELGLLRDPILRVSLSSGLHALSADNDKAKLWKDFLHNVRGTGGQRGLMLLAVPFYSFQLHGIDGYKLLTVANHLSALQKNAHSSFRNVYRLKNLLHTMHSLVSNTDLTADQKHRGFEKIFLNPSSLAVIDNEQRILNNVNAAKVLLQLKDTQWPNATENLSTLFRSSLEKLIPLQQFKGDLSIKYEEIFATCRNPSALLTYAAGLKTLGDPMLLSCLGQFLIWVMEGTFKNNRYERAYNPHLAKILEGHADVLSKWREEIKLDVETIISEDKKEEAFDSEQWLRTKLVVDKHLGSEKLPYFVDYIRAPSAEARKGIFSALINEIKKSLSTLSSTNTNNAQLINLNLQKACLRLVKEGKISDKKSLMNHLEEIHHILHQAAESHTGYGASEFATDVKGLLNSLKKQAEGSPENKREFKAIFTDDPLDLLLCGTDVSGSCQRVEGNPEQNKGLLGYLIDGKNRLLAIKDGDKIVARCMLKLLWDGQQPVIYRERFYPDQISVAHKHALNALAKQVSQKLAIPLTGAEGSVPYNNRLHALGGPAPYEYSDGVGGVQKNGVYSIQAHILD